ncbi:MAG: SCO family protein [Actinomycetota bacterium]|nr:SCO family protein [Actinomycetota bacterium]
MLASVKLRRVLMVVLVALVAAIVFVALRNSRGSGHPSAAARSSVFEGPTMPPGLRAHDFTLSDQTGRRVHLARYRGHVVVLTFIHSLCRDACPFMVEQIKGALNELPGGGRGVPAVGVSVQPSQDTVARRRAFLTRHEMKGRLAFVSGPPAALRRVWHAYGIAPVTPRVDHSTFVILIDKRGLERVGFAADQLTPEGLAHDIRVLENEPA